jgi:dTDP-4-amino-4,6-dideoxygalactose transaminase
MSRIYLSPPDVRELERVRILEAIDSNWIAPVGPDLDSFETEMRAATGVTEAVGVASGTAALHLALHALGVSSWDEVLVSTLTFAAPANAVRYVGAHPVFVDADPNTWTLSPQLVQEELSARAQVNRLPKAAIPVDLYGQCADYQQLLPLFERYEIPVIEDAAEALGATAHGELAGSFGRCSAMSFNGNKIITTSGGGMFLSKDPVLAGRVQYLANQAREPVSHYEHVEVGFNYRLSNLLAAFGRGQLATLADRIARRREINSIYRQELSDVPGIELMPIAPYGDPNFWLTCILLDREISGTHPEALREELERHDIETRRLWKPMHMQPVFAHAPRRVDGTSDRLFAEGLCLPSGSAMTDAELTTVIERLVELIPAKCAS